MILPPLDPFAGASGSPLESSPSWSRRSGPMVLDGRGGASPTTVGQEHYDYAGSYAAPYSVSLTVDLQGGSDAIGPAAFSGDGTSYATERVDGGRVQIILVVGSRIVGDVHSALSVPSGPVVHTLGVAADGTVTATAGSATCSIKSPVSLTVASVEGDHLGGPVAKLSAFSVSAPESLFFLCRHMQLVSYVAGLANRDKSQTDIYSEEWGVTADAPAGYAPPTAATWHSAVDASPLGNDVAQAGYLGYPFDADRRTPTIAPVATLDARLYWPVYAVDLAAAKARWAAPMYSAGRSMTFEEYAGYVYRGVAPAWFAPTPMPWQGLNRIGCVEVDAWTNGPAPIVAPYDASVRLP